MLIRLVFNNFLSFKEETEFNLLPNKSQRLPHHKLSHNGVDFLRMSAIYGANGSGKSNMVKAVANLEKYIAEGKVPENVSDSKFKLSPSNIDLPISIGVEFFAKGKIYYYAITFDNNLVLEESLSESKKDRDELIYRRSNLGEKQEVIFFEGYASDPKNNLFTQVLQEKLLGKNELLLSFLNDKYKEDFDDVAVVYDWFDNTLVIVGADAIVEGIPHVLDKYDELINFANELIPTLSIGIKNISVKKQPFEDVIVEKKLKSFTKIIEDLKKNPNSVSVLSNRSTGEQLAISLENEELIAKSVVAKHLNDLGESIEFPMILESDGTKRLIEYIPALFGIIEEERVFLIDEIERSIHPKTIKEIITKISLDLRVKGQLIFTTHESCLLDQDILRTDEIWFAQKSIDGASRLYPLSDFNVHHTANIENGYLNGRFGGIPFLSNLQDLNWHKYAISE
ncbi:AAA family ATPase [Pedobacter nototheniae]|uniref:AAA family ATPase n=1 Tax=Pedobacter nototheniae TaxID=2488994 RepID=UPI00103F0697|nr:ATP-binding protein [Pedobacter nototheniae]